ncbi:MAG TPA: hemerythrin domain-containing protein [Candidatus Xenobia bacterium]|nr:hemerythrin domain-containing protein [Candidatus Xenobia bacterium]
MAATQAMVCESRFHRDGVPPLAALERQSRANQTLRVHLLELTLALFQVRCGGYGHVQSGLQSLGALCRVFQEWEQEQFRREQAELYPALEEMSPRLRGLLGELRGDLIAFRRAFESFREAVLIFNASGELGELPRVGQGLANILGQHLHRQEAELFPLLQEWFEGDDPRHL